MEQNQNINQNNMADNVINFDNTKELEQFFDGFIKKGVVIKDREIVPGMKIKLKVLDTGELLAAESILSATNPNIPPDVIQKVRGASILSQALLSINDMVVERETLTKEEIRLRRISLYQNLLRMPAIVIQKAYELYVEAAREQNKLYEDGQLVDKIENFSERHSEK
jgi:hypothetical protein